MSVIVKGSVLEDQASVFLGRIVKADGSNILPGDISGVGGAIAVTVYDKDTATKVIDAAVVPTSSIVALANDSRWTVDDTGYNFDYTGLSTWFPSGGTRYRVEFTFTMDDGHSPANEVVMAPYDCISVETYTDAP